MGYRRLNEREWALVEECFPSQHMGRPRKWSDRDCLDAVLFILSEGCRWNSLPDSFPPSATVFDRFSLWVKQGIFQKILSRLRKRMSLGQVFYLDSTVKPAKKGQTNFQGRKCERHENKPRNRRGRVAG
jgi:transposase